MDRVEGREPQYAGDYDDRTTSAVRRVLVEMGQIFGSFGGKFVVIGGAVPWLLIDQTDMPYVGTVDIDVGLDAEALGDGEYAELVESLKRHGYEQREERRRFQLVRQVDMGDGGPPVNVVLDFLMPRGARTVRNRPPLVGQFAVQKADGVGLALRFPERVELQSRMPTGGTNRVTLSVAGVPAFLAMKGFAINSRLKRKDAYDIYYCVCNYPGGIEALAEACRSVGAAFEGAKGYGYIAGKFETFDSFGPTSVREFIADSDLLGERTPAQWQQSVVRLRRRFRAVARHRPFGVQQVEVGPRCEAMEGLPGVLLKGLRAA